MKTRHIPLGTGIYYPAEAARIHTYVVAGMATRGSVPEVSDAYGVSPRHVNAAVEFEQQLRHTA
jgi:hypothetical protein